MKIGITGDISLLQIKEAIELKLDYLFITGDFGYIWTGSKEEEKILDFIGLLPITVLFIDGNHENYKLLNKYPIEEWQGGKVQNIRENIIHLMRGEIYNFLGKTIFTFGGAKSIDRQFRIKDISWFEKEMPSQEEMKHAVDNLYKNDNSVDIILTHTCAIDTLNKIVRYPEQDDTSNFLSYIKENINYDKWFFGHLHNPLNVNNKEYCLYKNIKILNF